VLLSRYVSTAFRERNTSRIAKVIRAAYGQMPHKYSNSAEGLVPHHTRKGSGLSGGTLSKEAER